MKRVNKNTLTTVQGGMDDYRDKIDLLANRAELLVGKDREIMRMYLNNSSTFRQIARVAQVNEATIARRIFKITQRLIDGQYITILRNKKKLRVRELQIAKDYFLQGLSIRKIAQENYCSYYRVRETLKKIQAITKVRFRV